jgi:hypothetical protein
MWRVRKKSGEKKKKNQSSFQEGFPVAKMHKKDTKYLLGAATAESIGVFTILPGVQNEVPNPPVKPLEFSS